MTETKEDCLTYKTKQEVQSFSFWHTKDDVKDFQLFDQHLTFITFSFSSYTRFSPLTNKYIIIIFLCWSRPKLSSSSVNKYETGNMEVRRRLCWSWRRTDHFFTFSDLQLFCLLCSKVDLTQATKQRHENKMNTANKPDEETLNWCKSLKCQTADSWCKQEAVWEKSGSVYLTSDDFHKLILCV